MKLGAIVGEAIANLLAVRGRSVLALVGISVGIGSVIAMITIGEVVAEQSLKQFRELGTDILKLESRPPEDGRRLPEITPEDVVELPLHASTIMTAAAWTDDFNEIFWFGSLLGSVPVFGVTEAFADIGKLHLESGRFVSDLDYRQYHCVVGSGTARAMRDAGAARVLGERIRVFGRLFTIVGVLRPVEERGYLDMSEPNANVYLPITTMMHLSHTREIRRIVARMRPGVLPDAAAREAVSFFESRAGDGEFRVESSKQLIEQMGRQSRLFALLLGAIGGISLVVGGVGVMNVMLISVNERRGEIGIRRAVGARRRDIRRQFVAESVALCLTGGMLGIGLGIGSAYGICGLTGMPFHVSATPIVLGVATSTAVGIFFGLYPAHRASRLDPIAALRG